MTEKLLTRDKNSFTDTLLGRGELGDSAKERASDVGVIVAWEGRAQLSFTTWGRNERRGKRPSCNRVKEAGEETLEVLEEGRTS